MTARITVALLVVATAPSAAPAEVMKEWVWRSYAVRFRTPADWGATVNSARAFIANSPYGVVKVAPCPPTVRSPREAAQYGLKTYTALKARRIIARTELKPRGGFSRYLMRGTAVHKGLATYFGIVGLERKGIRLYVRVFWYKKVHKRYSWLAELIVSSFESLHTQRKGE